MLGMEDINVPESMEVEFPFIVPLWSREEQLGFLRTINCVCRNSRILDKLRHCNIFIKDRHSDEYKKLVANNIAQWNIYNIHMSMPTSIMLVYKVREKPSKSKIKRLLNKWLS